VKRSRKFPLSFPTTHLNIPWKDITGMRDVLDHEYLETDLEIVWKTVQESLPVLKSDLSKIMNKTY